jgi:hypothetical protein
MRSLSTTFHPALRILNDGIDSNDGSACGQIGLFIQGVNGFKVMKKLSDTQAENLINQANRIDHRISCSI